MTRCTIGAVLLVLAWSSWAGDKSSMMKNCRLEWPSSAYWRQACYDHHKASHRELVKLRRNGKAKIVNGCIRANPGAAAGTDWSAALVCARYEMKNARRR